MLNLFTSLIRVELKLVFKCMQVDNNRDVAHGGGRGRGSGRGGRMGPGKGRGRGRDGHAPDVDTATGAPSQEGRFPQPPIRENASSPDETPYETGAADGLSAPHRPAIHGSAGKAGGRGAMVTPAELFAQAEDGRASAGNGRPRSSAGSNQHRPTFYGREVSAGHQEAHQGGAGASHLVPQDSVAAEAPAGSRRYLANRAEAGLGVTGRHTGAAVAVAAAPSMVPVHHADDDAHNMYFNPNAPGFLPMGGEGVDGGEGAGGNAAVVMMPASVAAQTVPAPRPPGQQLPYMRRLNVQ